MTRVLEAGGQVELLQGQDMFHDYATTSSRLFNTSQIGVAQRAVGVWLRGVVEGEGEASHHFE